MAAKKRIPDDVRQRVEEIIQRFNESQLGSHDVCYVGRFKAGYLHLDRSDYGSTGPVCRLRYTGDLDEWEFAIYKFSRDGYDPDEWMFPGSDAVDGTIEGAMIAGLEAYPP